MTVAFHFDAKTPQLSVRLPVVWKRVRLRLRTSARQGGGMARPLGRVGQPSAVGPRRTHGRLDFFLLFGYVWFAEISTRKTANTSVVDHDTMPVSLCCSCLASTDFVRSVLLVLHAPLLPRAQLLPRLAALPLPLLLPVIPMHLPQHPRPVLLLQSPHSPHSLPSLV